MAILSTDCAFCGKRWEAFDSKELREMEYIKENHLCMPLFLASLRDNADFRKVIKEIVERDCDVKTSNSDTKRP